MNRLLLNIRLCYVQNVRVNFLRQSLQACTHSIVASIIYLTHPNHSWTSYSNLYNLRYVFILQCISVVLIYTAHSFTSFRLQNIIGILYFTFQSIVYFFVFSQRIREIISLSLDCLVPKLFLGLLRGPINCGSDDKIVFGLRHYKPSMFHIYLIHV